MNRYHLSYARKALLAATVGYAMDGFDLLILGFILSAISADFNLNPSQAGSLMSFTLLGSVIGGIFFGILSDYVGRIKVLNITILIFALFTGLCGLAVGYWDLLLYRTLAGFGLGGEFGIGMSLAAEASAAERRARATSVVALGWQSGVLLAALVSPILLPYIGWRGMFIIGVIPAFVSFLIRYWVSHDPHIFVKHTGKPKKKFPLQLLFKDVETTKISFGIFLLCAIQNFGYFSLMIWLPTYLSKQFGYSLGESATWTAVTILGMCLGIWVFGQLADRIGRRPVFVSFQIGAAIMVYVYSTLTTPVALLIGGAVMGFFVDGMIGGYGALISELYPTEARATAQNFLFNLGRAAGGLGPVIIGVLIANYSFASAIILLSALYLIDAIATIAFIPERKGEPLT